MKIKTFENHLRMSSWVLERAFTLSDIFLDETINMEQLIEKIMNGLFENSQIH